MKQKQRLVILDKATVVGVGPVVSLPDDGRGGFAISIAGAGNVSATVLLELSDDPAQGWNSDAGSTFTVSGSLNATEYLELIESWRYMRATVIAVSAGASVTVSTSEELTSGVGLVRSRGALVAGIANGVTGRIDLTAGGTTIATSPVVLQTGIPMILPSSGSIGNNGALSGITALPAVYSSCYMFFPENAIFAGSLAGMYYVVMSSNTAGTIYNNAYTGGQPSIPSSPTAFVTTGPGAYTQSTSAVEVLSGAVAKNAMGVDGRLEIRGRMSFPNNANTKSLIASFADTNTLTFINSGVTANLGVEFGNTIQNRGSAAVQVANATSFGNLGQTGAAALRGTVDTTQAQTLRFKLVLAVATDYAMLERLSVDCFPL